MSERTTQRAPDAALSGFTRTGLSISPSVGASTCAWLDHLPDPMRATTDIADPALARAIGCGAALPSSTPARQAAPTAVVAASVHRPRRETRGSNARPPG